MDRIKGFLVFLFLSACLIFFQACSGDKSKESVFTLTQEKMQADAETSVISRETGSSLITVYLCGAVRFPGVYTLEKEARLYQAVEAAGGMTESAKADAVNLARIITDGEQIIIPYIDEAADGETQGSQQAVSGLIDLNHADVSQLSQLPGIGEVKAQAIVDYRSKNGPFTAIEEVKNVPGIKEASFEKIRDKITVS